MPPSVGAVGQRRWAPGAGRPVIYWSVRNGTRRSRPPGYAVPVKLLNLDHVAIAVHDLDEAIEKHRRRYGVTPMYREVIEEQGVEEAMLAVGGSFVQLLAALHPGTPVGRFLQRRGEGLHHIAYAVVDIEAAVAHLQAEGALLVDKEPREGGRGTRIAFVHPRDGNQTLVELVEYSS